MRLPGGAPNVDPMTGATWTPIGSPIRELGCGMATIDDRFSPEDATSALRNCEAWGKIDGGLGLVFWATAKFLTAGIVEAND